MFKILILFTFSFAKNREFLVLNSPLTFEVELLPGTYLFEYKAGFTFPLRFQSIILGKLEPEEVCEAMTSVTSVSEKLS